ncbi:tRNA uridine-5-carboxymethylaminomethyl(34) synthesis GTPase MnmE [Buchnera aphidicola (Chaitoregma tattakana)]|uniref:tRNA uridine-5-carboxymethylaminomethyl(34) synthesis GTPase MnmE n=1 Tax=Buchnera aphidicola TaxID=9 RepID=UPI0031B89BC2
MYIKDTIVALATPYGISGVSILRVSGIKVKEICNRILHTIPKVRYANYLNFFNVFNNTIIDKGIVIRYEKPNSFTGEDILEFQCHGSRIVIDILLKNILFIKDVRIANNGEFSRRAFFNNKIDLLQAEAIDDLINSNSEVMLKASMNALNGTYSVHINKLSKKITHIISDIEIILNIENEYDSSNNIILLNKLEKLIFEFKILKKRLDRSSILREGLRIVIAGVPNSGKSSLFNCILSNDRSIVTEFSGTTRDVLIDSFSFEGSIFNISDTAGINFTKNKIEKIGIQKAWKEMKYASCVLLVTDDDISNFSKNAVNKKIIKYLRHNNIFYVVILNKCDIKNIIPRIIKLKGIFYINLSAKKNLGINILLKFLKKKLLLKNFSDNILISRRRHLHLIEKSLFNLIESIKTFKKLYNLEILSENLFKTRKLLDSIVGKFHTNDLLDSIFSNFCFGK